MPRIALHAFASFPEEAAILGRLLAGYGEVEYELTQCLGMALGEDDVALKVMYRMRSESQRLHIADALMRPIYEEATLGNQYSDALGASRYCLRVRNQYAHCHWFDDPKDGLFFMNFADAAEATGKVLISFRHVDVPLLSSQEEYFCYTLESLVFLYNELKVQRGVIASHTLRMPPRIPQPNFCNPPEEHPVPSTLRPHATPI